MNIRTYYLYRIFNELMPIYPLYMLMFEKGGMSITQMSGLLAIWSVPAVLLEIPTGVIADHYSRRNMLLLGQILRAAGYLTWIFANGFWLYALGFILWGIGGTFRSGSEEALLYDSLKAEGNERNFDRMLGRGRLFSSISTVLASVVGGYLGMHYGFLPALLLSILSALLGAVTVLSMKEVNLYKEHWCKKEKRTKIHTLFEALSFVLKKKEILLYCLLALMVLTTAGMLDEYDQLIAKSFGLSITMIGSWSALRFLLIACGGYLAPTLHRGLRHAFRHKAPLLQISALCSIAAGALLIAGLVRSILAMALYGLYYLIMAAGEVIWEDDIQQRIEEEGRSTVHSVIALCQNLYGLLCYGLFGGVVASSDLFRGMAWTGIYLFLWIVILCTVYLRWKKGEQSGAFATSKEQRVNTTEESKYNV